MHPCELLWVYVSTVVGVAVMEESARGFAWGVSCVTVGLAGGRRLSRGHCWPGARCAPHSCAPRAGSVMLELSGS